MDEQNKNLILATVLSFVVILGWFLLFPPPETAPTTPETVQTADGTPTPYPDGALTATPLEETTVDGRTLPTRWRLELPARGVDVTVAAVNTGAWMTTSVPYWEGPVTIDGTAAGVGYLEMTGYD